MSNSYKKPIKLSSIFLLCSFLIFISNDTFFYGTNINDFWCSVPRYASILVVIILLIIALKYHFNKFIKFLPILLISEFLYLSSCLINQDTITFTGIYMIFIAMAFLICICIDFSLFFKNFEKIIYFIAIVSIIFEIFSYLAPSIIIQLPTYSNIQDVKFIYIGIWGLDLRTLGSSFIRSTSIFWEPGVFSIYLNLALLFCLFIEKKNIAKKIFIYGIALFFTFSTAGYIVYLYLLMGYVIFGDNYKYRIGFLIMIIVIITLVLVFNSSSIYDIVFSKLNNIKEGTTIARLGSFIVSFRLMLKYPIFGVGQGNLVELFKQEMIAVFGIPSNDYTNGFLYYYVVYGILFGVISTVGLFKFSFNFGSNNIIKKLYFLIFFIFLFIAEHLLSSLPFILIFYGLTFKKEVLLND